MRPSMILFLTAALLTGAARADFNSDLLAAYFFDGSGEDGSGQGQHGQLVGATFTTDRAGRENGALLLDGQGAYVATPVSGRRFPVSVSFWFRVDERPGARPLSIIDSGVDDAFGHGFVIGSGPDRLNANLAASYTFRAGVWTHVVVTYGAQLKVYMDGQPAAARDYAEAVDYVAGNFQIGRHFGSGDGRFFKGAVDDVLIYGRTLSAEEVRRLHDDSAAVKQHIRLAADARARLAGLDLGLPGAGALNRGDALSPQPFVVAASSGEAPHTNVWDAVDTDTNTLWEGAADQPGWWLAVGYDPPLTLRDLSVSLAEGSSTNMAVFHSMDARAWPELATVPAGESVEARYLLFTFPADGSSAAPRVSDIRWR